ncbi:ABC transporter substrate-binding protein [Candidatus Xianfuyuplasma coldseepsis]|uniref:ABC transporter substrate-binding protein n=1 Tax=Candidatus Xianfuyuplasma coldseepsis TaxID=2782163 RepID=A0A7L7KQ67_9MOLU|nr:ABC transporter substrate-binding protein [Xianfuyuplasma coldseepsis]QMS84725.1 ABC transporter substrate-binding protein [Xianfuyuplasma coldseepsis]
MKKVLVLLATFVLAFSLSACKSEEDTVKLGVIGPLTGAYSFYGEAVENGAKLAADEINAAGGVLGMDLVIFAEDSEGDAETGVNAYRKLVDNDEIDALIGGTFSGVTDGLKDLAIADGLPVLSPTATRDDITLEADNVFRVCYNDSFQGSVAAVFAAEDLSATKAAVMFNSDDPYSAGLADAFKAEFDARSLAYDEYEFSATDVDFSAQLTNIEAGDYDVVFLPAYVAEIGPILQKADELGIDIPFIGGDGWDGIEADYADEAEGNYFTNHYSKSDTADAVVDFVAAYEAAYGSTPNALAALAYDAVYVMAQAMEDAGSTDSADVIAALSAVSYAGAVTSDLPITFNDDGDPVKSITILQVTSGDFTFIKKVNP